MRESNYCVIMTAAIGLLCAAGCGAESSAPSPSGENRPAARAAGAADDVAKSKSGNGPQRPSRAFRFHYAFGLTGLEPNQTARLWLPVPVSNEDQIVEPLPPQLPAEPSAHSDAKYGNRILYVETTVPAGGELTFDVPYRVQRFERQTGGNSSGTVGEPAGPSLALSESERQLYLQANARVPIAGRPLELLHGLTLEPDGYRRIRQLYDTVDRHVSYRKDGDGWGRGDVLWVCDSGFGNCTDFHSLFISLARSQGLPARFEIGFSIPTDRREGPIAGYHCWAYCYLDGRGWLAVDISEADKDPSRKDYYFGNLTPDRVAFTTGRDIALEPAPASPPLNFFIYPHVEIDGAAVSDEQLDLRFSFDELEPDDAFPSANDTIQ